jgi:hypothetical protein
MKLHIIFSNAKDIFFEMFKPNYYNKKKHKQSNLYMSTIYTVYYSLFQKATVRFLIAYENIKKPIFQTT